MAGSGKIRVLIVDDILESRDNVAKLLRFEPDVEIVGMAESGEEGIDIAFLLGEIEDSSLRMRTIMNCARVLVASPAYLAKRGEPETLDDLDQPLVTRAAGRDHRIDITDDKILAAAIDADDLDDVFNLSLIHI